MKLFTADILKKLQANSVASELTARSEKTIDHKPVVKIFNPYGAGTWLFTEIDEDGVLFGLAHIHDVELGYASRVELETLNVRGIGGLERDILFVADKTLSQYADEGRKLGHIKA